MVDIWKLTNDDGETIAKLTKDALTNHHFVLTAKMNAITDSFDYMCQFRSAVKQLFPTILNDEIAPKNTDIPVNSGGVRIGIAQIRPDGCIVIKLDDHIPIQEALRQTSDMGLEFSIEYNILESD